MTAPVLRALSAGEILDMSFTLYRRHFGPIARVTLLCTGIPVLLSLYLEASGGMLANLTLAAFYYLIFMLLSAIATAATVHIVSESYLGRALNAASALGRATPVLGRLLVCSFLLALVIGLGLLLLFLPGIVLACGLVLAIPAAVLEAGATPIAALARSWELTRGFRWRMFGLLLTLGVLLYIPIVAIGGLVALFSPKVMVTTGAVGLRLGLLSVAAMGVVQVFVYPIFYCVLTLTYYDLRVRKEGFDLEVLAASLHPA